MGTNVCIRQYTRERTRLKYTLVSVSKDYVGLDVLLSGYQAAIAGKTVTCWKKKETENVPLSKNDTNTQTVIYPGKQTLCGLRHT